MKDAPSTNGNERDSHGRFSRGNRAAVGRSNRRDGWRHALRDAVTDDDWREIVRKAIEQARSGDENARRFVAEYALGKPRPMETVTSVDLGNLSSVHEVVDATVKLVRAAGAGEVSLEAATRVGALLAATRETLEVRDLEERLKELERRLLDRSGRL